jgi:hypothetical protein
MKVFMARSERRTIVNFKGKFGKNSGGVSKGENIISK